MTERNYGIDLLRIVSMFYVIVLHVFGQGGVLAGTMDSAHYSLALYFETFSFCAVDCFALISGFVGYRENTHKLKISNYINIWLQVVFYNIVIMFIYSLILPDAVKLSDYKYAIFPVTMNRHWYFTAYTGLFFITPLINAAVQKMDNRILKKHAIITIILYSFFASFCAIYNGDNFILHGGYSVIWLAILYFLGAVIKKTGLFLNISPLFGIPALLLLALQRVFITYISPAVLIAAIIHLALFAKIKVSPKLIKLLSIATPGVFAVYIINTQKLFYSNFMGGRFAFLCTAPLYMIPLVAFGFAAIFVIASVLIDYFRRQLFAALKINKLPLLIEQFIDSAFERFV